MSEHIVLLHNSREIPTRRAVEAYFSDHRRVFPVKAASRLLQKLNLGAVPVPDGDIVSTHDKMSSEEGT